MNASKHSSIKNNTNRLDAARQRIHNAELPACTKFALMSDLSFAVIHDSLDRLLEVESRLNNGLSLTIGAKLAQKSIDDAQRFARKYGIQD